MTREELKEHCEKQIEMCEMWAIGKGKKPSGNIYEEHKLILELLEQKPCEDAVNRQSVLNTLDNMDKALNEDRTVENYKELLKECYEVLPSVTPQPKMSEENIIKLLYGFFTNRELIKQLFNDDVLISNIENCYGEEWLDKVYKKPVCELVENEDDNKKV